MRIRKSPADPELLDIAKLQGHANRDDSPPLFNGDFRAELAKYLYKQKMGVRAQFDTWPALGGRGEAPLSRVEVPDHLACDWTVTLSAPNRQGVALGGSGIERASADQLRAFAEITVGVGSAVQVFEIDWKQGCRFVVSGSSVSVKAILEFRSLIGNPVGYPLVLSSLVVPGSMAQHSPPPTRTVYYGTIGAAAGVTREIPRFAYSVQVQREFVTVNDLFWVIWYCQGGTQLLQENQFVATNARTLPDYTQPIIVPPEATYMRILEGSGAVMDEVVAIYRLYV